MINVKIGENDSVGKWHVFLNAYIDDCYYDRHFADYVASCTEEVVTIRRKPDDDDKEI